ncbi:uncharacterized protein G2W53_044430 [Senna tora]|uniref:Uncharacterized protein n=1 Tax=Senna tora TaxID=362788 RepID=A0A834SD67_9FABA|nr:uncharacterized protein G2W53_044430 [Senna tora]
MSHDGSKNSLFLAWGLSKTGLDTSLARIKIDEPENHQNHFAGSTEQDQNHSG